MPVAALVGSTLLWIVLEAMFSIHEPHERLPREVATGLALFATHVAAIVEHATTHWFGLALIASGIALRIAAIRALGTSFVSSTTEPSRLVRSGPYRVMRHPSEIGLLAAASGAAVLLGSVIAAAVIAAVLVPLVFVRCAAEDRGLAHLRG
jgi:protein-S-isoprenylcysteine O-methyltransferase